MNFFWTLVALVILLGLSWRFLGSYMASVYEGKVKWLNFVERPIYKLLSVDPDAEQTWTRYALSLITFSAVSLFFTYWLLRLQGHLPFNPEHLSG